MSDERYSQLAQLTKNLGSYRLYREQAEERRAAAISEEDRNIEYETKRIEELEAQIRETRDRTRIGVTPCSRSCCWSPYACSKQRTCLCHADERRPPPRGSDARSHRDPTSDEAIRNIMRNQGRKRNK